MPCDSADISLASTARADASCGDASTAQACGHTPPDSSACVQVGLDALRGAAERRKRVAEMQARVSRLELDALVAGLGPQQARRSAPLPDASGQREEAASGGAGEPHCRDQQPAASDVRGGRLGAPGDDGPLLQAMRPADGNAPRRVQAGSALHPPCRQPHTQRPRPATAGDAAAAATNPRRAESSARRACPEPPSSGDSSRALAAYTCRTNARDAMRDSSSAATANAASDSCASTGDERAAAGSRGDGLEAGGETTSTDGRVHDMGAPGLGAPTRASTLLAEYEELIPDLYLEIESLRAVLEQERERHAAQGARMLEERKVMQAEAHAAKETLQHVTRCNRELQAQLDAALEKNDLMAKENALLTRSLESLRARGVAAAFPTEPGDGEACGFLNAHSGNSVMADEGNGGEHNDLSRGGAAFGTALAREGKRGVDAQVGGVSSPCRGAIEALILAEEEEAVQQSAAAQRAGATAAHATGAEALVSRDVAVCSSVEVQEAMHTHLAPPADTSHRPLSAEGAREDGEAGKPALPASRLADISLSTLDATLASLARGPRAHPIESRLGELHRLQHQCGDLQDDNKRLARRLVVVQQENAALRVVQARVSKDADVVRRKSFVSSRKCERRAVVQRDLLKQSEAQLKSQADYIAQLEARVLALGSHALHGQLPVSSQGETRASTAIRAHNMEMTDARIAVRGNAAVSLLTPNDAQEPPATSRSAAGKALPRQQTEHANMSPGAVTGSGTCERSEAAAPQEGDDQDVEAADSACSSECGAGLSEGGAPDNGVASSQVLELQPKDFFSDDLSRPSSLSPPSLANSFLGLERSRELGAGVKELAKAEQPTGRPEEGERGMEVGKMCTEKVNLPSGGRGSSCTAITERGERTAEDRGEGGGRDEWTAEDRKKVGLASRPKGKETLTPSKIQGARDSRAELPEEER